jgi:hypothetical protein
MSNSTFRLPFDADKTMGGILIGIFVTCLLYGLVVLQTLRYFMHYLRKDS